MQKQSNVMSPLVESSIYRPFISAVSEIGLPDFPPQELMQQLTEHLLSGESPIPDSERALAKFAKSVLRGEIIAAEASDAGVFVFFVRGGVGRTGMHVRMTCRDHAWHVDSVHASYSRPLRQLRWLHRSVFGAAVLVAAVVGYALHSPTYIVTAAVAPQKAHTAQGDNHPIPSSNQVAPSPQNQNKAGKSPASTALKPQPSTKGLSKTVTYHLAMGAPLYNLAQFLYSQHLIPNAMNFDMTMKTSGVDLNVKPGTYVFPRGGTTSQFISILKKGPK